MFLGVEFEKIRLDGQYLIYSNAENDGNDAQDQKERVTESHLCLYQIYPEITDFFLHDVAPFTAVGCFRVLIQIAERISNQ